MPTEQQVIDRTNELARKLYALRSYNAREGYRFDQATHPHVVEAWEGVSSVGLTKGHNVEPKGTAVRFYV